MFEIEDYPGVSQETSRSGDLSLQAKKEIMAMLYPLCWFEKRREDKEGKSRFETAAAEANPLLPVRPTAQAAHACELPVRGWWSSPRAPSVWLATLAGDAGAGDAGWRLSLSTRTVWHRNRLSATTRAPARVCAGRGAQDHQIEQQTRQWTLEHEIRPRWVGRRAGLAHRGGDGHGRA